MKFHIFILLPLFFSISLCEVDEDKKVKLLSDFMTYYNLQPSVIHEGINESLLDIRQIDPVTYHVDVTFTVDDGIGARRNNCSATIKEQGGGGISIVDHDLNCTDLPRVEVTGNSSEEVDPVTFTSEEQIENVAQAQHVPSPVQGENSGESTEVDRTPIKLENEVQADTAVTSGEQFIAIPRNQSSAPCIGCSSHVNPEAKGVRDLANLGIRHLDLHEPTVNHSLDSIIDIERQVQVVNGVRYILTLSINFSNCTESITELCTSNKICKITILVKPWQTLPSGVKYRSILANNCTEEWLFGDDGEVLPEVDHNKNVENHTDENDEIRPTIQKDLQSQSTLTEDRMKALEDQILPLDHVRISEIHLETSSSDNVDTNKDHLVKNTSTQQYSDNSIPLTESAKYGMSNLSQDKKNAIDKMLDFFHFSEFTPKVQSQAQEIIPRVKRSQDSDYSSALPGGITSQNPNDEKFLQLANESLQKYLSDSGNGQSLKVDHIDDVSTQVVAGIITRITFVATPINNTNGDTIRCFSKIYEQPWIKKKDIEVSCKNNDLRVKRQVMTGGQTIQDPNKPEYLQLAKESLQKYVHEQGNTLLLRVARVDRVVTQVVSGSLTKINFVATDNSNSYNCFSKIWEQSWLNMKEIDVSCDVRNHKSSDILVGGEGLKNPNDPKYLQLAQESMQKYVSDHGIRQTLKVARVDRVTTQVVEGLITRILFVATSIDNSNIFNCFSKILEQDWLYKKEIDVTCDVQNYRVERQVPGGETSQNPYELKYLQLAQESLQKYESDHGYTQLFKVVRVDRVTTQVVSGSLTKINFVATNNSNSFNCFSKIWERSWLNKKEIDVTCDVGYSLQGGEELQNPNDPEYLQLAQESMQKYVSDHGIRQTLRVARVDHVTTQVVSGSMTRINFVATSIDNSNTFNCFSKIWEESWLNRKEIDVTCDVDNHRVRRQILGGETQQNPNDSKYLQLAQESLQKYQSDHGFTQLLRVAKVDRVVTQVVSGSLTKINFVATDNSNSFNCSSIIWEQSWLNKKEIDVTCDVDNHRVRRQTPGGETQQNPNDSKYLQLAQESLQKYQSDHGFTQLLRVARVDRVVTQVVSGSLTKINFVVTDKSNSFNCFSQIWEQSWLNKKEINVTCDVDNHRVRRQIPGGETQQNPNDSKYLQLAQESLQKYQSDHGFTQLLRVARVDRVVTQVVSGSLTKINFVVTDNSNSVNCFSQIWEQSWLNKKEIDVTCDVDNQRVRRQIPGGETQQNPNDSKYLQLAQESLQKYVHEQGYTLLLRVARVDRVVTQVVSGSLTKINFVATDNSNSFNCFSKIWEQSWLNMKEIDVSCDVGNHKSSDILVGGEGLKNPNDPKYLQLAQESMQKYVSDHGIRQTLKVARVDRVTTQVVAGLITRILFVATSIDNSNIFNCFSKILEQDWLNKKEIDVTCDVQNYRVERQVPGGETSQNPNKLKYLQLAQESLQKYESDHGYTQLFRVVRVDRVTTQVVSGSLTKINFVATNNSNSFNCFSKIWERSWLNKKEIDVTCDVGYSLHGGEELQNPNDPEYLQLAQESMQKYVSDHGIRQTLRVARVDHVTTQVVSGSMTRINFVATSIDNSNIFNCFSKIWEESWLNRKEIDVTCDVDNHRVRRQILGGETQQNPNDSKYLQLAQESLQKYQSDHGFTQLLRVARVDRVVTQVVSGSLTKINFVVTDNSNSFNCFSQIWEQSWLNKKEIDVTCDVDNHRVRRQIPGGETQQNPNDSKYLQLAQESLQKYQSDHGFTQLLRVAKVNRVVTQVVSGSLTKINFVVTDKSNSFNCFSQIWEQSWLNKKEINVTCDVDNHRVRRQIPGGETQQNPNDSKYLQLAQESLLKYQSDHGFTQLLRVARVDRVVTQVVSGSLTKINFVVTDKSNSFNCFSQIWEQSWLNKKEINVTCDVDNHRVRRQIPGGETQQNPNDSKYLQLAQESLQKYQSDHGFTQLLRVARVDRVVTQVVSGSLTKINFVVTDNSNSFNCFSQIWEQSWLNKKEIDVTCDVDNHRVRRQIPGGETQQNPNDSKYLQLAQESLQKYQSDHGFTQLLRVARVDRVVTQVVSGSLTKINFVVTDNSNSFNCFSQIWEQSWLNKKEIDVTCDVDNHRVRRQIPGGETQQNPNDSKYLQLAQESLQKYQSDHGFTQLLRVAKVNRVVTQVVSGSLTKINFVVTDNSNSFNCFSQIWEQSWLNKKEINVTCDVDNHRVRRQIPGGETQQNPNDSKYLQLAQESLQKYQSDHGFTQLLRVARVDRVVTQVVSGSLTKINFVVTDNSNSFNCFSQIWEQSWLNKKEIDVTCDVDNHRLRRQIPGGETQQNPNDSKYLQLAQESLQKYQSDHGFTQLLRVAKVNRVVTQVVSGSLTKINFVVTDNSNSFNCFSQIWEQSWLNKKEINVTCDVDNHRVRRQIPGGETQQNPNDSKYLQLAQESLQKYQSDHGFTQLLRVAKVDRVVTQVVSGSLTKINFVVTDNSNSFNCFSQIWEQSWLNKKEIDVTCDVDNHRVRRQIPGGEIVRDPDDPKYMELAEDSLYKYLTSKGIQRPHAIVRIDKVTSQVVSGSLTTIYFVMAPTNHPHGHDKYCISKIWEQSWVNKNDIEVSCSKKQVYTTGDETELDRLETIGGEIEQGAKHITTPETELDLLEATGDEIEQDPKKPEYMQLAEESLQKYLSDCGNKQPHRVVRVDTVTTQVVVGSMTRINFVAVPTENSNNQVINCFSKILEQSWLNNKEIDVTCDDGNHRVRRDMPGGETSQNPNGLIYLHLAQESLQKYVSDHGNKQSLRVARVDRVTTQVVSGSLTKINFVATSTDNSNSFNCFSQIWEQSWLNKKEIDVTCDAVIHRVRRQLINEELSIQDPNEPAYLDLDEDYLRRYANDSQHYKVGGDISCSDNQRVSRQVDNDEAAFFQLAEDSLKKYLCDSGIHQPHKVVKVDNVTTQYDAGSITELDFVAVPSDNRNETTIICFSKIWEQIWLEIKEIDVTCDIVNNTLNKNEKATTAAECTLGTCTTHLPKVQKQLEVMEINETKIKKTYENETTKPEYLFLAARALHKFSKKIGVLHKLNSVIQVATSSEYGMVYNIKFSASPTECFADVSITRALECRVVSNTTVFCDAIIREVPGLKRKIHVACDTDDEDTDFDDYSDTEDTRTATLAPSRLEKQDPQNAQKIKVQAIAEEALQQFLATTTKKRLYRIVEILSFYEHLTDGMISTVEFLISPTICFRGDPKSVDRCPLKVPNSVYHCNAKMRERPILGLRRDIKVGCKKLQTSKSKALYRTKRRIDDEITIVGNSIEVDHKNKFHANQVNDNQEDSTLDFYHRIQAENLFYEFLATYNPSYADDKNELEQRFQIFKKNIKKIHELNIYEKGTATYGVTRFADLTYEEFRSRYTGLKTKLRDSSLSPMVEAYIPSNATFPDSFDWRELGAVTEVKDQGSCGSCWAFSVTGNIEGQLKIHSGKLVSLSEQELLDCDHKDLGCDGGIVENAYRSIEEIGGLDAESDYPYKAKRDKCRYDKTSKKVSVSGAWNIGSNETNMAKWLVKNGPISVGINAQAMQFYKGGIAHPWKTDCNPSELDHAVLIVGYGIKEYPHLNMKLPYWIVKNSWGKSWGEEGYYLVYRGDGTCGINTMPTSAKIVSS